MDSALHVACKKGDRQFVEFLLEEGADPTLVNHGNATALDLAEKAERAQSAFYIRAFMEAWEIQNPTE